jgi:hypothetical protein
MWESRQAAKDKELELRRQELELQDRKLRLEEQRWVAMDAQRSADAQMMRELLQKIIEKSI